MPETGESLYTRREVLCAAAAAGIGLGALGVWRDWGARVGPGPMLRKSIPVSGETIPVIGLGTGGSFSRAARDADQEARLLDILTRFVNRGATVIDTAPNYGRSEEVLGALLRQLGLSSEIFLATKVADVRGRRQGLAQANESIERARPGTVDLHQVHNLVDWQTQLPVMRELQDRGLVRYVGVTAYRDEQYAELEEVIVSERLDFIQVDYAINNRSVEDRILPLAADRGLAVVANMPFGAGRLFQAVGRADPPRWLAEFAAESWAQFFLRWIVSHPQVTVTIPSTTNPTHLEENLAAGCTVLPTAEERVEMLNRFSTHVG